MTAAIFFPFFAPNIEVLLIGQIISGIPWGMYAILCSLRKLQHTDSPRFQTLGISYAPEVCPIVLRGYLTTYANICWV
jgi:MFS transporter, SP family, general alpha glucoside:H+ symporter